MQTGFVESDQQARMALDNTRWIRGIQREWTVGTQKLFLADLGSSGPPAVVAKESESALTIVANARGVNSSE
jgi:hypothetical protein